MLGEPSGNPHGMLARAYLEELYSRETAKQAAGRMHSKDSEVHRRARQEWTQFRDHVIAVFPETSRPDLGGNSTSWTIGDQVFLGREAKVSDLFELLHRGAGSSLTARQGLGIYGFLSGGTHPSLYQARQLRSNVDNDGNIGTFLKADVAHLERLLVVPVLAYYNALSYVIDFYGLDRAAHDELTTAIDQVLPGALM
ncbi:hypothetical protein ORI20_32180 [Mycobacterium sp. CVI_P3]|uniref:Uncharacterized protein n=1 Tax=Mycobacterium pinniadriaticum TaxID=2994102 RepID=A0ABT3SP87_9MYCO|nr:hypothetical protein [Mycobacterium pinniadriaticum]MCX2934924.1 hypothetical protein [Mycobacterium pinniadriaticum]MCX2941346.1 hypothetical protein [Mycobacterium pinniadriaticum]